MCLIIFSWQPEGEFPLVMAANRDEFYQRPACPVHYWNDNPNVFGGLDLESGGTWLAVSKTGRFAAVTNYREVPVVKEKHSRGELVKNYLYGNQNPVDYLKTVLENSHQYSGFNLLVGDFSSIFYFSNRTQAKEILELKPGYYGLCNHLLGTPWPKLIRARRKVIDHIQENRADPDFLISVMHDQGKVPDHELPDTGIGLERERLLSSPFIASDSYGTRNTSILIMDKTGHLQWTEQNYKAGGQEGDRLITDIQLS